MMRLLLAAILVLLSTAGLAKVPKGDIQFKVAPEALKSDRAYLLFRSSRAKSGMLNIEHIFLRVPNEVEIAAYRDAKQTAFEKALPGLRKEAKDGSEPVIETFAFAYDGAPNVFTVDAGDYLEDGKQERTYLIEVPAGTYVLYGISAGGRSVVTCNCLGTVKFEAKPGIVTFMGALYADKVHEPSPVPHLEDNRGPSMFTAGWVLGQAVVPAAVDTPVPLAIGSLPIARAEYFAVAPYHDPAAMGINRLAPVPGILDYDRGRVIDTRTGAKLR